MIPSRHLSLAKFFKHPGADVAVVHDDHWGAVIGEVWWFPEFFLLNLSHRRPLDRTRTESQHVQNCGDVFKQLLTPF